MGAGVRAPERRPVRGLAPHAPSAPRAVHLHLERQWPARRSASAAPAAMAGHAGGIASGAGL
eukprot:6390382-Lingulodinium_polyedra.AAC.1